MLHFTADPDYGQSILEKITIRVLHNVQTILSAYEKTDKSLQACEKFITNYFQAKIDECFENDRLMFLCMPDELETRIRDEDLYSVVNQAYVSAFLEGYKRGVVDMQELESLTETVTAIEKTSEGNKDKPNPQQPNDGTKDIPF